MRLPDELGLKVFSVALGFAVASCAPSDRLVSASNEEPAVAAAPRIGPQADFPVVVGEPFTIDGITYTPADTLNYDEVGYATVDQGAVGVTASHRTLPLPSYVEVTSLETGRTILVRVERRGPMTNARLIALSEGALLQLGGNEGTPVRVRRVVPPEEQRAELRAGREAPLRMDTPSGLVDVLRRKLPAIGSAPVRDRVEVPDKVAEVAPIESVDPDTGEQIEQPVSSDVEFLESETATDIDEGASQQTAEVEAPGPVEPARPVAGDWVVQAGAFSARQTAERIALEIGGYVESAGRLWRVRNGPYANRGQAEAALAKVRGAGYRGAQVYRVR